MAIQGFGPIVSANPTQQTVQNPQGSTLLVDSDVAAKGTFGAGVGLGVAVGVGIFASVVVFVVLKK